MRARSIVGSVAIAWLTGGGPLESSPFVVGAPYELAGIEVDDSPRQIADRCRDHKLNTIELDGSTFCMRAVPPFVQTDAIDRCAQAQTHDVTLAATTLSPREICEPFLVASPTHHGSTMTLVVPIPAGVDLAATHARYAKDFTAAWGGQRSWESRGGDTHASIRGSIRAATDIHHLAPLPPPDQLGLAGFVLVELDVTYTVDPLPHAPCRTEGCGCTKRTVCPA